MNKISNEFVTMPSLKNFNEYENISQPESHVWHLFVVRVDDRNSFLDHLELKGIGTLIHYPIPPNKQEGYPELQKYKLPITEILHEEVVSLPLSPVLKGNEVDAVVNAVNSYRP